MKKNTDQLAQSIPSDIFFLSPADDIDTYITSALLDIRRALARTRPLPEETTLLRTRELPPCLTGPLTLPPWEKNLLADLYSAAPPVLMVRGGAGCGKTSAARFLARYCQALATRRPNSKLFGLVSPLVLIDLQGLEESFKHSQDRNEQATQERAALQELALALEASLKNITSADGYCKLFREAVFSSHRPTQTITGLEITRQKLGEIYRRRYGDANLQDGVLPNLTHDSIAQALSDLPTPHHAVSARLLLLARLAYQATTNESTLIVIIDNIDPFPEYIQQCIFRTLAGIAFGQSWPGLKIAVFTRLSTAAVQSAALDGAYGIIEFQAPDPSTIVFFRTSRFLLDPKSSSHYLTLGENQKRLAYQTILSFWRHLTDRTSEFARVFSGLTGTNVRNALILAKAWCASPEARFTRIIDPSSYEHLFRRAVGAALLNQIAEGLARGVREVFHSLEDALLLDPFSHNQVAESLATELANLFAETLVDHRLLKAATNNSLVPDRHRTSLSHAANTAVAEILEEKPSHEDLLSEATLILEVAFSEELSRLSGISSADTVTLLTSILQRLAECMEYAAAQKLDPTAEDSARLLHPLSLWFRSTLAEAGKFRHSRRDLISERESWDAALYRDFDRAFSLDSKMRLSRFKATALLISPETGDEHNEYNVTAVNLFSCDGMLIEPAPLRLLCLLEESPGGLTVGTIRDRLIWSGFSDASIELTLGAMIEVRRRLVYAGVRDYHDGLTRILQDISRKLFITAAGLGYRRHVSNSLAYLQWAFLGIAGLRREMEVRGVYERSLTLLPARLYSVLYGFAELLADENTRTDSFLARGGRLFGTRPLRSVFPVHCLLFEVLYEMLTRAVTTAQRLRFESDLDRDNLHLFARDWIALGVTTYDNLKRRHGLSEPEWEAELLFAEQFLEKSLSN